MFDVGMSSVPYTKHIRKQDTFLRRTAKECWRKTSKPKSLYQWKSCAHAGEKQILKFNQEFLPVAWKHHGEQPVLESGPENWGATEWEMYVVQGFREKKNQSSSWKMLMTNKIIDKNANYCRRRRGYGMLTWCGVFCSVPAMSGTFIRPTTMVESRL